MPKNFGENRARRTLTSSQNKKNDPFVHTSTPKSLQNNTPPYTKPGLQTSESIVKYFKKTIRIRTRMELVQSNLSPHWSPWSLNPRFTRDGFILRH